MFLRKTLPDGLYGEIELDSKQNLVSSRFIYKEKGIHYPVDVLDSNEEISGRLYAPMERTQQERRPYIFSLLAGIISFYRSWFVRDRGKNALQFKDNKR